MSIVKPQESSNVATEINEEYWDKIPIPHLFVRRPPDQATSWYRKQENKFNYLMFSHLDIPKKMTHLLLKEVPNVKLSRLTHDVLRIPGILSCVCTKICRTGV